MGQLKGIVLLVNSFLVIFNFISVDPTPDYSQYL